MIPDIIEREGNEFYSKSYVDKLLSEKREHEFYCSLDRILKRKFINTYNGERPSKNGKTEFENYVNKIKEEIKTEIYLYYQMESSMINDKLEEFRSYRKFN